MTRTFAIVALAGAAAVASAQTHYFTQGDRLYSTSDNGASVSQLNLTLNGGATTISSLAFDNNGTLWAGGTSTGALYTVNLTTGALTPTAITGLGGQQNTFDFRVRNNVREALIFTTFTGGSTSFQIRNADTGAVISPAQTVLTGTNPGIPASAFPGSGNTLYCFDGVSYNLRGLNLNAIGTPAVIGNTGIQWSQAGGSWHNNQLWLGTRIGFYNGSGQTHGTEGFRFGTVNTTTGAFTEVFRVSERPLGGGFGYAVIPAPGTAVLMGLAGITAGRRRR